MLEQIENKIFAVVEAILAKPSDEFTKTDYEILASEYFRLKTRIDSLENSKKMTEMLANLWAK